MEDIIADLLDQLQDSALRTKKVVWVTLITGDSRAIRHDGVLYEGGIVATCPDPKGPADPSPVYLSIPHIMAATIGDARRY